MLPQSMSPPSQPSGFYPSQQPESSSSQSQPNPHLQSEYPKLLVALSGDYNSGKTYLMNKLENKNFQSSYQYATPAFGFIQSSISDYIYMDTQGLKRLASSSLDSDRGTLSIKDIKAIDNLISQTYKVANIIIEVRDTGNNEDICNTQQRHAEYLQDRITSENQIPVMVVVVHNFKNLKTISEVERYIRDDITNPEIGGQLTVSSKPETKGCKCMLIAYYIILKVLQDQGGIPKVNFLNKIIQIMEQSLGSYIKDPKVSKDSFVRVKKDETIASYWGSFFSKTEPEKPTLVETHEFKITIQNNTIKLINSSFDLEFYKDSCGFKSIDYSPQYDVVDKPDFFSIVYDAPNSYVQWLCSQNNSHIIVFQSVRKFPTYLRSDLRRNIYPRTYGNNKKEFQIPSKPGIDCARLSVTAKHIDGVAFVSLAKDNNVIGGSPFPRR
ncbi:hypothetical protein DDB_G0276095 [Dictyostelium discoideum AX4]|uniref:Uncharacterized protein n=1 Tax=Dictyostelium discoideum TaxID=44689 RepID=Q75JI8_DICDI|nr:hypothetical protein DDB_G0276095 [Dictyostelium discoideum AX4]EAL69347.1 hypothetical protein DDB_G0276095 [Dictyostelium discoideum AX4]|eukprot:XP_643278.1 hypothetical protein DDB_G0276095 [Dictyostelium discoideum AX4]